MSTPPLTNPPDTNAPYSVEAEMALLGSLLVNPSAIPAIAAFIQADDFFILRHGYVWEALLRLNERGDMIDFLTVSQELNDQGRLATIGGSHFLTDLANKTPSSVHAEVYARIVERTALRRKLLKAADDIRTLALDEERSIENVINEAESKLLTVGDNQTRREFVPMWEALSAYYDRMERMIQNRGEALGVPSGFAKLDELLGGFQRSDLLIFAGRPGMGKCVAAGTLVHTENGLQPIERLKPDVSGTPDGEGGVFYPLELGVQTPDGLKTTSHFYDSGPRPTLKLTTRAGYSLSGTYQHPVLILDTNGQKIWKPLSEIEAGDYVAVQRHDALWGNSTDLPESTYDISQSSYVKQAKLPKTLTSDFAYMLGLLVGDGGLTHAGYVTFSSADQSLVDVFHQWAAELELNVYHNTGYDHRIGSVILHAYLAQLQVKGYAHEKIVPDVILKASREHARAFLQGLFDTDGHAESQRGYLQFLSSSQKLTQQVHLLLLQFGIISKLTYKPNDHRGAWSVRITGKFARKFYDEIGFRLRRKQERQKLLPEKNNGNLDVIPYLPERQSALPAKPTNYYRYFLGRRKPSYGILRRIATHAPEVSHLLEPEFYWDEIVSIKHDGNQHCYDLCVPDGHAFVANGIVNHNTSWLLTTTINAARMGARIAIFTMEMGVEQIVQRFVAMETGINVQKLRLAQLSMQEQARFTEVLGRISRFQIFIDDTPAINPMEMRTKCRRLMHEYGLDLVIVDYMQLMNAGRGYENNRVQEISFISRNLKEMAREFNIPVISAAQLSRAVEQRQDKRPVLSDLRESGCLTGDTLVYQPDCGTYTPIRDLVGRTGFRVTSLNLNTWKLESATVTNAFSTGVKPVYSLETALGRRIRATGNHKFLTIDGWKRLDQLAEGDFIALPRRLNTGHDTTPMQDAEVALLGHLIGDGCTLPKHAVQYTTVEHELAEIVSKLATEVFDDAVTPRIHQETGHNWYQVFLKSTEKLTHGKYHPIRTWLESLGAWGLRSHEKFVPHVIFSQSKQQIAIFIKHLWATDGCIRMKKAGKSHYPMVYYATSSVQLAYDVQTLLLKLGINARIKVVSQKGKGRDQYHVIVTGQEDLYRFVEIGTIGQDRKERLSVVADYLERHQSNTNRDVLPSPVWHMLALPAMKKQVLAHRQMQAGLGMSYCGTGLYKQNISRERAARLAEVVRSPELEHLATSDVYWDRIKYIAPDGEETVYDLTVEPHHNFVADNIIVHNSIEQDADIVMFLYRDEVYNEATEFPNQADVIVAKHRNGPTGVISLYFEKSLTKFLDASVHRVDLTDLE